ncbi:MAG: hypothetical protein DDT32_00861 [Syntrophomonadaceae bacterium]|nr:hypothetical protein [Bacillota bacterium]
MKERISQITVFISTILVCIIAVLIVPRYLNADDAQLPVWTKNPTKIFQHGHITLYLKLEKETIGTDEMALVWATAAKDGTPLQAKIKLFLDGRALPSEKLSNQYLYFLYDNVPGRKKLQVQFAEEGNNLKVAGSLPITITPGKPHPIRDYFPIGTWYWTTWGWTPGDDMRTHTLDVFRKLKEWGINTICAGWLAEDDKALFEAGSKYGIKSILNLDSVNNLIWRYYDSPMSLKRFEPVEGDIKIEGEDFIKTNGFIKLSEVKDPTQSGLPKMWRWGYDAIKDLSGKAIAHLWQEKDPGSEGYYVKYSVPIKEEGTYKIVALMSAVSRWHLSPFSWQMNSGPVHHMDKGMAHGSNSTHDGCKTLLDMSWHQLGFQYLSKGEHTLKIIIDQKGIQDSYTQSIDKIIFRKVWEKSPVGKLVLNIKGDDQRPAWEVVVGIGSVEAVTDYNGIVQIDGIPVGDHSVKIFPIDSYLLFGHSPEPRREMINKYRGKRYLPKEIVATIKEGQQTEIDVVLEKDYFSLSKAKELAKEWTQRFKGNQSLLGYYIVDEPEYTWADDMAIFTRALRYYDANHPAFSAYSHAHPAPRSIDKINLEVVFPVIYRHFKNSPVGDFGGFETEIDNWRKIAGNRPFWVILPAYSDAGTRWPTAAEARAMVYMSIARGAKGIFYFYLHPMQEKDEGFREYVEAVTPINKKLLKMASILTKCVYSEENIAFCSSGEVHTLKDPSTGTYYLVVINKDMFNKKKITVTVPNVNELNLSKVFELPEEKNVSSKITDNKLVFEVELIPGDGAIFRLE